MCLDSEPGKSGKRVAPYRAVLYLLSVAIGLLGLVLVLGSLPGTGTFDWDRDYSGSGVVLLAAALTAAVATASATSFKEQRAYDAKRDRAQRQQEAVRDREQRERAAASELDQRRHEAAQLKNQRENDLQLAWRAEQARVYEELIALVVRSFAGGSDLPTEAAIRGKVAIWGGEDLVEATGTWMRFASDITKAGGTTTLEQKREAHHLVGQIVDAARRDLGEQQSAIPDRHAVLTMIFNDYERPDT
jgi:hypothetical protein